MWVKQHTDLYDLVINVHVLDSDSEKLDCNDPSKSKLRTDMALKATPPMQYSSRSPSPVQDAGCAAPT